MLLNVILRYLEGKRQISRPVIDHYLEEVTYRQGRTGKTYFAFGMKNRKGGYEIRVATDRYPFKSAIGGREVSWHPGSQAASTTVTLFEGMTDFLSAIMMLPASESMRLAGDAVVLHSISSVPRALQFIREHGYRQIHGFLDPNTAGRKASNQLHQTLSSWGLAWSDYSGQIAPHADLNALWCAGHKLEVFAQTGS